MKKRSYVISKKAVADLEEIWHYTVEKWSVEQADRYYNLIFDEINYICKNSNAGKSMEDVRKGYHASKVLAAIMQDLKSQLLNMTINNSKMTKYFILFLTTLFTSCKGQTQKSNPKQDFKDPIAVIQENEKKATEKNNDHLGELVSTISFQVKTDNKKDYENGLIPWASIEKANQDIPNLLKKDEVVIKENLVKVLIDYPLTNQYEFILKSNNGFTRQQLLLEISLNYFKLYKEEEKTATVKTIPIDKRTTMYNRNQTNGKYGIWGHDIADLVLDDIQVYKTTNGEIILTLNIGS